MTAAARGETDALDVIVFAAEEPEIEFPVCVGLTRIDAGAATPIPVAEGQLWDDAIDLLGDAVGRTVFVLDTSSSDPVRVMADIRDDARAQALDFVIVYELAYDPAPDPRAIQALRLFPPFDGENPDTPARAAGAAVLLDVADGMMYGVSSAMVADGAFADTPDPRAEALRVAVVEISHEVETAFIGMMIKAGMPAPVARTDDAPEELTPAQIIARADANIRAAYGEAAGERGCEAILD